jgi:DsbC/DsbD-like thiol-disulfide interchange protein/cytochrome c biogenesis protein CcdA
MWMCMLPRLLILLGLLVSFVHGEAVAGNVSQQPNTRVELFAESMTPAPGQPLRVGVSMTARPGWHTYWQNPGDSGMETRAAWNLPEGASVSAFRYPVPSTYVVEGLMNHVYEGEAVLLAEVSVPADARGAFPLRLKLDWLVCDDRICVPESAELALPLTIGDGATDGAAVRRLDAAEMALPRPLATTVAFQKADGRFRLAVPVADAGGVRAAHFFPLSDDATALAAPQQLSRSGDLLIIETMASSVPGLPEAIEGVLRLERADGVSGLAIRATPGEVPPAGTPLGGGGPVPGMPGFPAVFGLAVLGGLLLNLMPCVFPILSLKAMSLAKAGAGEAAARRDALGYAAGAVLVCVALGAAVIALAAAGQGAGWAFQLQDPRVILLLMLLTLAIGLNFAGLFEMQLGTAGIGQGLAARGGWQGSFWTGVLAAFVATPCTGPFMAGALGAALVLPPALGLAVFAGLGLGLALPFLAVGFVPALRRRMPRPGPWMATFRRILAIPMLLTAVALAWVLGRQAGADGLALGLLAALSVGLGLWWLGLRQGQGKRALVPAALALLAALAAPAALARLPAPDSGPALAGAGGLARSVAFSPAELAALRADRRPVFLYFTADWCVTCKVNERGALASPEVARAFEQAGVTVMVGDWTRPNPDIARFLAERQRAGIPLYLFYDSRGGVTELPQILTASLLVEAVGGHHAQGAQLAGTDRARRAT